jgi:sporulation protein YabP
MSERIIGKGHRLVMEERERVSLSGVRKVQSFEEKEIVLDTDMGMLSIKGEKLGIKQLDLQQGLVDIEGRVEIMAYARQGGKGGRAGLWDRILR